MAEVKDGGLASGSVDREAIARVIDPEAWTLEPWNENWSAVIKERQTAALTKADAILALLPAQAVTVKPLEWEQPDGPDGTSWLGHGVQMCEYYIRFSTETASYWMPGEQPLSDDDDSAEEFLALEAAKAAAQANYEARIRSALIDEVSQVPEANAIDPAAASKQPGSGALSSPAGHIDVSALRRALELVAHSGKFQCFDDEAWGIVNTALAATSSREVSEEELHQQVFMSVHDAVESKVTPIRLANEVWTGTRDAARAILSRYRVTKKDGV